RRLVRAHGQRRRARLLQRQSPVSRPHSLSAPDFPARSERYLHSNPQAVSAPPPFHPMKIREIRCAGLRGATPEGGWSNELRPDDCVHTLVAVHTDEGALRLGSVFTNDGLVRAALAVMERLYRCENAL